MSGKRIPKKIIQIGLDELHMNFIDDVLQRRVPNIRGESKSEVIRACLEQCMEKAIVMGV